MKGGLTLSVLFGELSGTPRRRPYNTCLTFIACWLTFISQGLYFMLWYAQGDGFNAKREAEQIFGSLTRSGKSSDQLRAAVGMHSSIQLAIRSGFAEVAKAWTRSNRREPLFTYEDSGVIGAIKVAGDGRSNTRDVIFLGMKQYVDINLLVIESSDVFIPRFVKEMERRLRSYQTVEWL